MRKAYPYFRVLEFNKRGFRLASLIQIFLFSLSFLACTELSFNRAYKDWEVVGGDQGRSKYSSLDQINQENVADLEIAWEYHTLDQGKSLSCNPIIVDGIMYVSSPKLKAIALDALTGKELWRFDPFGGLEVGGNNQGLTYWEEEEDKRIFLCAGKYLFALNAENGQPIADFGQGGKTDLSLGFDKKAKELNLDVSAPAAIYRDRIIIALGGNVPGIVRAYDVRNGEMSWSFQTIPQKGEPYEESWEEESYLTATGAHINGGFCIDEELGMVFFATGSPGPDFSGWKHKGQNLFANSVVALNVNNGDYIWHFQEVHHDIWNLDLPCPPVLLAVYQNNQWIDALAQVGKTGNTWLLNRLTGEPLFPYKEINVPTSEIAIEKAWPTQPKPESPPPFSRQQMSVEELTQLSDEVYIQALESYEKTRSVGWMQPINTYGTIYFGLTGGASWGGAAVVPDEGILYVNANEIPWFVKLQPDFGARNDSRWHMGNFLYQRHCANCHGTDKKGIETNPSLNRAARRYRRNTVARVIRQGKGHGEAFEYLSEEEIDAMVHFIKKRIRRSRKQDEVSEEGLLQASNYQISGMSRFLDANGYPAVKPPWGTLSAIDLNKGRIIWQVPLGEYPELTERGFAPTGTENAGGCIVTDGGLIFIAATRDEKFRAFDRETGQLLWEYNLPFAGYANPATYEVNGRQFVVIAAGGGKLDTPAGDTFVAFALPK